MFSLPPRYSPSSISRTGFSIPTFQLHMCFRCCNRHLPHEECCNMPYITPHMYTQTNITENNRRTLTDEHSWLPRMRCTLSGYLSLSAKRCKITSHENCPLSAQDGDHPQPPAQEKGRTRTRDRGSTRQRGQGIL